MIPKFGIQPTVSDRPPIQSKLRDSETHRGLKAAAAFQALTASLEVKLDKS